MTVSGDVVCTTDAALSDAVAAPRSEKASPLSSLPLPVPSSSSSSSSASLYALKRADACFAAARRGVRRGDPPRLPRASSVGGVPASLSCLRGRPRPRFLGAAPPPSLALALLGAACLRGRPRPRFGGGDGASLVASSLFVSLGGGFLRGRPRPRFFGGGVVDPRGGFLRGRPRPRLGGISTSASVPLSLPTSGTGFLRGRPRPRFFVGGVVDPRGGFLRGRPGPRLGFMSTSASLLLSVATSGTGFLRGRPRPRFLGLCDDGSSATCEAARPSTSRLSVMLPLLAFLRV